MFLNWSNRITYFFSWWHLQCCRNMFLLPACGSNLFKLSLTYVKEPYRHKDTKSHKIKMGVNYRSQILFGNALASEKITIPKTKKTTKSHYNSRSSFSFYKLLNSKIVNPCSLFFAPLRLHPVANHEYKSSAFS